MAPAEREAADLIGVVVDGRYKITQVIASGSMGSVYQAERIPVGKLVAIKFLHASVANDSEFQARFERETRVASKLAHPNCVSVLDFGVWDGVPYLVMEHVAGTTLRDRIDQGPLEPWLALAFARQIAAGLAHAHEQGIFHRDIKPANLMITDEIGSGQRVRILDFGLARLRGNVGRDATQTNMVVGTPNYMAPEQTIGGGTIDARTDIYAVGIVLFEMVVGDRPFHAEDTLQLLGMQRAAPIPRLADRVPADTELPARLQELIDKAMAKAPADRYQTAIALTHAIDEVSGKRPSTDSMPVIVPPPVIAEPRPKETGRAASAPTIELEPDASEVAPAAPPRRSRSWGSLFMTLILVGGAATGAAYLVRQQGEAETPQTAKPVVAQDANAATVTPTVAVVTANDAASVVAPIDAELTPTPALASDAGVPGDVVADALPEELEMDPSKAVDLDPAAKGSGTPADDEAADAPKTHEEVEKKAQPPQLATTMHDALELVQQGKRDLALASLRALRTKNPKSAYVPFLMGNLYFDERWWSVAMETYADAIKKNAAYKSNATLNRNVIRMLSSPKTQGKAAQFLHWIGHPAAPFLQYAAKHEDNPVVRKQAAQLARSIH